MLSRNLFVPLWSVTLVAIACQNSIASDVVQQATPLELFEQRILPIFRSAEPSSCVQCHLSAVDLKEYIRPSQEKTFASLRDQGLIDLDNPSASKILTLIKMGEKDLDAGARLIHAETRQAEYEAFTAWIEACCKDPRLRALPSVDTTTRVGPKKPEEVIRHARKSRVVDSFIRNVWSQRMRCYPCHTPHEIDGDNPKHQMAIDRAKEFAQQFGDRMHIFRETPEATMDDWIARSRAASEEALPLINFKEPSRSLIILKPTSKVPKQITKGNFEPPSYVEPVSHMGGLKMHPDDYSYKALIAWIEDFARVVGDEYASVGDLPEDNWHPTKHVLIMQQAPTDWPDQVRVQLFVHARIRGDQTWDSDPIAFTQGTVTPRKLVNGVLFRLRAPEEEASAEADELTARLAPGKYLIKVFVDSRNRLAADPTLLLGDDDYYGRAEIEATWGEGFPEAERFSGEHLQR